MLTSDPLQIAKLWSPVPSMTLPAPHFSYSPVVRAGGFIFVSGLVGLDPQSSRLVDGGIGAQTLQILQNLERLSEELGLALDQLMLARIYCADFTRFGEISQVWETFYKNRTPPARTSVGATALPLGALVEMEFQFVIDPSLP